MIMPEEDDAKALRFDALMYGIELAYLVGKKYGKARSDLFKKVSAVASVANIPEIMAQAELLDKILHTDYVERAGINEFEHITGKFARSHEVHSESAGCAMRRILMMKFYLWNGMNRSWKMMT